MPTTNPHPKFLYIFLYIFILFQAIFRLHLHYDKGIIIISICQ